MLFRSIYQRLHVYEKYQEYFRGKHYLSFSKHDQAKLQEIYGVDTALSRNEFDPQDIKLSIDDYKIFEIKGYQLASSSLMAGSNQTRHITTVEEVTPQNITSLKHRILGVLIPPDAEKLRLLR